MRGGDAEEMVSLDLENEQNYRYIDPDIRILIHELNRIGLKTKWSCQGHEGQSPYITFHLNNIENVLVDGNTISLYWKK